MTANIARELRTGETLEEMLHASLKEKELLVREIHHRVRNNLQVISGLLTLQANRAQDDGARELLRTAEARINAMALVHDKLYLCGNLSEINADEYLPGIIEELTAFGTRTDARITVEADIEAVRFGPDTAISVGLIVTELLNNSLKHAFSDRHTGTIRLELRSVAPDVIELLVSDDGIGMPDGMCPGNARSLGLDLVAALVQKLRAEFRLSNIKGTQCSITFKRSHPADGTRNHAKASDTCRGR